MDRSVVVSIDRVSVLYVLLHSVNSSGCMDLKFNLPVYGFINNYNRLT